MSFSGRPLILNPEKVAKRKRTLPRGTLPAKRSKTQEGTSAIVPPVPASEEVPPVTDQSTEAEDPISSFVDLLKSSLVGPEESAEQEFEELHDTDIHGSPFR